MPSSRACCGRVILETAQSSAGLVDGEIAAGVAAQHRETEAGRYSTDSQISFDLPVFDRLHSEILEMMVIGEPFELSPGILKQYVALRTSGPS